MISLHLQNISLNFSNIKLHCVIIVVCNAGYYKTGSSCELCTGNKIKSMTGDAAECNGDTPCDGVTEVPDAGHSACGIVVV